MGDSAQVLRAREALVQSIDRACLARGEAQWTNGYLAARFGGRIGPGEESNRIYAKEQQQWKRCDSAEHAVRRALTRYRRALLDQQARKP